jgi:hypothetical protein
LAEDGRIRSQYPLKETRSAIYALRTRKNVEESDGTLILYADKLGTGSEYTAEYAHLRKKPFLVVDVNDTHAKTMIASWISDKEIKVMNIAGPRESTSPGIYQKALWFLEGLLG